MSGKMKTYATYTKLLAPTRKGGWWSIRELPIGADSPDDAAAFAEALCDSLRSYGAVPRPDAEYSVPPCPSHDGTERACMFGAGGTNVHTGKCVLNADRGRAQDICGGRTSREAINALAERFRAMRGVSTPVIETPRVAPRARKPRAVATASTIPHGDRICPRCLRADFRTDKGRTWHVESNPDCVQYVKPDKHVYAEAS
jgi:hypothetical protein